MKRFWFSCARVSFAAVVAGAALVAAMAPAKAQHPSEMSCGQLWHERNKIYARNGYCFKTERARAEFGRGCFPPYGDLRGWERRRVNEIQMWESRNGCN
ncbi:YARHG domain-containing protein [Methylocystis sp. MJC1]|jgi:hypothetical protein|uniref:YARHG domain-containing protein n=1 Tax=Methylocystis sp. MJC1 TaxID=2654282 RepID=UPI0013EDB42A|nr:YARHG domain-containing protein [Methylocystis sp. MJC1]KAF2992559.1 hypothetical protein MJC1_00136 [Methylocystis sp. MJC1]MBU6526529.1 YARHG domain-containing protein [Methylocystis sp. MJC1]UZX12972.1 YARHG domain-containing protein [Methylocystis sp. MJC1]